MTSPPSRGARRRRARTGAAAPLPAYVLHRYDWSESSLILDLFTREQGRIAVAAKGAKRPYSQLRPVLLPFQRIHVSSAEPTPAAATTASRPRCRRCAAPNGPAACRLPAARRCSPASTCNELLMKLLARHDPHPRAVRRLCRHAAGARRRRRRRGAGGAARLRAGAAARDRPAARPEPRRPPRRRRCASGERLRAAARARRHRAAVGDAGIDGATLVAPAGGARPRQPSAALRQACGGAALAAAAQPAARAACTIISARLRCAPGR